MVRRSHSLTGAYCPFFHRILGAVLLAAVMLVQPPPAYASSGGEVCYVVADRFGQRDVSFLGRIDLGARTETEIGLTGARDIETIAYDPYSARLYGVDTDRLGRIDLTTGLFTPRPNAIGSGDGDAGRLAFNDVDGLAFDPFTGRLYGSVRRVGVPDVLIQLDVNTGRAVEDAFGPGRDYAVILPVHGVHDIDDIAFDLNDGHLYATSNDGGLNDRLIRINKYTGETWDVAGIRTLDRQRIDDFEGLSTRLNGELVATRGDGHRQVHSINRENARVTFIMPLRGQEYESLACYLPSGINHITGRVEDDDSRVGLGGVTVRLFRDVNGDGIVNAGDHLLDTQDTDASGNYDFALGADGLFVLDIDAGDLPSGASILDSGFHRARFDGFGQTNRDNDFRYALGRSIDLNLTKTVDNQIPAIGDEVEFTLRLRNEGRFAATGVVVEDIIPYGLVFVSATPAGEYDELTGLWTVGKLDAGRTRELRLRVRVERDPQNCAEVIHANEVDVDSTPDNERRGEDDMACIIVSTGNASSGADAGIESNGDMATQLAQRLFGRRQDAMARQALHAAPVPVPFIQGRTTPSFAPGVAGKAAAPDMSRFVPARGPQDTQAHVVTSTDLLGVTNATSVFAADYLRPEGRRLAALFGATSPAGVLYDHAKATCDRLGGGRLEGVQLVEVQGQPFVLSTLVHADGTSDHSISFIAYPGADGLVVDSRFAPAQYDVAGTASDVMNLQVWSVNPDITVELLDNMLTEMKEEANVAFRNGAEASPTAPQVYVRNGRYEAGLLRLSIVNDAEATSVVVRGTVARSEYDAAEGIRTAFERTVTLPASTMGEAVDVEVLVGPVFDVAFEVSHEATSSLDQLYYADGVWGYHAGDNAVIQRFETYAEPEVSADAGRHLVERDAYLSGRLGDWATLFRYLNPAGRPEDLSAYDYVEFTAQGQGAIHFVLEKAGITSWDQFGQSFVLHPEPHTYRIAFEDLKLRAGQRGFSAEDVTALVFYVEGNGYGATRFDLSVSDVSFGSTRSTVGREDAAGVPETIVLGQNYPNPFNPVTQIHFDLPEAAHARLAVFDVLGREVSVLVEGMLPAGAHEVPFSAAALPSGTYLYRLETPGQTLTRTMVLMK